MRLDSCLRRCACVCAGRHIQAGAPTESTSPHCTKIPGARLELSFAVVRVRAAHGRQVEAGVAGEQGAAGCQEAVARHQHAVQHRLAQQEVSGAPVTRVMQRHMEFEESCMFSIALDKLAAGPHTQLAVSNSAHESNGFQN